MRVKDRAGGELVPLGRVSWRSGEGIVYVSFMSEIRITRVVTRLTPGAQPTEMAVKRYG